MLRLVQFSVLALLCLAAPASAQDFAVVQQTADTAVLIDRQTAPVF